MISGINNNLINTNGLKEDAVWDIQSIFNYIVEHYKQFLLLLLSIVVVIIVDRITYYNYFVKTNMSHPTSIMTPANLITPTIKIIKNKIPKMPKIPKGKK